MMGIKIISNCLYIVFIISLLGCGAVSNKNASEPTIPAASNYICPMRCENSASNHPGKCPVCNMLLVKSVELDKMDSSSTASDLSIYTGDYLWTNQANQKLKLSESKGKYQLISAIFTNCEYACPNLISDMLNIDDDIKPEMKSQLNFILISIDPARDTPERLAAYANDMDLENQRWLLLNGEENAVDDVTSKLGVSYKKFENGAFGHSNILSLLNPKGEIIYQLEGIHANRTELVNLINSL